MNFFAHATIASAHSAEPRFWLGAMLPDLVGMVGTRIISVLDPELAAGVAYHHATDAAFHRAPVFTQLCGEAIEALTERSVERGTARAVAHVGIELLLDGVLSFDTAARQRYGEALRLSADTPIQSWLVLRHPDDHERMQRGLARLTRAPVPEGFREPDFVAARLRDILGTRPRLAMRPSDFAVVRSWAYAARPLVEAQHDLLLTQVRAGLHADRLADLVADTHADAAAATETA